MKISISQSAINWFKNEVGIKAGDKVKFYTQIYGNSPIQPGYSLAFTKDNTPIDKAVHTEAEGIEFYVEEVDLWFFNGHDLHVNYNEQLDELEFSYSKQKD